jgi:hypothetical protein
MSAFFKTLIAKYSPVDFFFDRYTLPNAPLLMGLIISKSLIEGATGRGGGWLTDVKWGETGGFPSSGDVAEDCLRW